MDWLTDPQIWAGLLTLTALEIVLGIVVGPDGLGWATFDLPVQVLSVIGLASLVWAIIEAPNKGWGSPLTLGAFALAVVTLSLFLAWELRVEEPMLNLQFFRNPRFTAASATITLAFFALFGFVFLSTQYLQFVLGYSPFAAGLRTLPFAGAMMVMAPLSSKLVHWAGTKRVVVVGLLILVAGLLVASTASTTSGYTPLGVAMLLLGAGLGPTAVGSRIDAFVAAFALALGAPVAAALSTAIAVLVVLAPTDLTDQTGMAVGGVIRMGVIAASRVAPLLAVAAAVWVVSIRRLERRTRAAQA